MNCWWDRREGGGGAWRGSRKDLIASGGGGSAVAVLLLAVALGMSVGDVDGLLQCAQGEPEPDEGPQEVVTRGWP